MRDGQKPGYGGAMLAVAVGGAAGASGRWLVGNLWGWSGAWPWPTFVVNVAGCLFLGMIAARLPFVARRAVLWRDGLATGFCGGLTTFSTFAVEAAQLIRSGRAALAVGYLAASLVSGWAAYEMGRRTTHHHLRRHDGQPAVEVSS